MPKTPAKARCVEPKVPIRIVIAKTGSISKLSVSNFGNPAAEWPEQVLYKDIFVGNRSDNVCLSNQLIMAITKEKKEDLVKEFQREAGDSGSPDVQIAILTTRIQNLTAHMQKNKKDYSTRRGLLGMVSRRRRLLDYVRKHDADRYLDLLERLNIRK